MDRVARTCSWRGSCEYTLCFSIFLERQVSVLYFLCLYRHGIAIRSERNSLVKELIGKGRQCRTTNNSLGILSAYIQTFQTNFSLQAKLASGPNKVLSVFDLANAWKNATVTFQ